MTFDEIQAVVSDIKYLDWALCLRWKGDHESNPNKDVIFLQWQFMAPDNTTGVMERQKGRKWLLSYHMTIQEIERTAFLSLQQAVHHEMCEQYYYRGVDIHNPHVDPDALYNLFSTDSVLVSREEHESSKL